MKFKDLLIKYRLRSGLNLTELSIKIGLSEKSTYISNVEKERETPPTFDKCEKLSRTLKLSDQEEIEFFRLAHEGRKSEDDKKFELKLQKYNNPTSSHANLRADIADAINDPIAVSALLVVHQNNPDIKKAIIHMLECLPSLSTEKRQAILALCK